MLLSFAYLAFSAVLRLLVKDPPDRARRDAQAELTQFAGDPRVAPSRVFARKAQDELSHPTVNRRTARCQPRLRPLPTHELAVPAHERLWRHDQAVAPVGREQSDERRKQRSIGWLQTRTPLLPAEYGQLMSQHE